MDQSEFITTIFGIHMECDFKEKINLDFYFVTFKIVHQDLMNSTNLSKKVC